MCTQINEYKNALPGEPFTYAEAENLEKGMNQIPEESSSGHQLNTDHLDVLCKGFDILALAATFLSAIQSSLANSPPLHDQSNSERMAFRAANALYLSGLILDLISACLAFLTSRWFQRLTNAEKDFLRKVFTERAREASERADPHHQKPPLKRPKDRKNDDFQQSTPLAGIEKWFISWYSMSLFVPMLLLVLGATCMVAGLYTYTWSQYPFPVAIVVSFAGVATVPFIVGVFSIGRGGNKRRRIILQLSKMQGDW